MLLFISFLHVLNPLWCLRVANIDFYLVGRLTASTESAFNDHMFSSDCCFPPLTSFQSHALQGIVADWRQELKTINWLSGLIATGPGLDCVFSTCCGFSGRIFHFCLPFFLTVGFPKYFCKRESLLEEIVAGIRGYCPGGPPTWWLYVKDLGCSVIRNISCFIGPDGV